MKHICLEINIKRRKCFVHLFHLLLILICATQLSHAQQGNNWYFGDRAGITFNTNPPSALLDGQMGTLEGCATISDDNGRLLFYTNGMNVWNKLHQVMPNGADLKGHFSATNSAIIIPKPGSSTIYYIFTAGAVETDNEGYFYSEVDMSLNGGLGDVTASKNILLYAPSSEKLTAARHSNGVDVWVITKALGNREWKVFKIDCGGVQTTPVISLAGQQPDSFFATTNVGCIKISPDGKKLAAVNTAEEYWELFQFDAATGVISNALVFPLSPRPYGVEFSPNSRLVYVGNEWLPPTFRFGGIQQYNISTYDSTFVALSKTLIGVSVDWVGALQMGPDNKIYSTVEFEPGLSVINSPDLPGNACNFVDKQVDLQGRSPYRGLPVFFPSLIINKNADFNYTINADCATVNFSGVTTIAGNVTWDWDFGDGTTGIGQNIVHTFTANNSTVDTVKLTVTSTSSCGTAVAVKRIVIDPGGPTANFSFEKECGTVRFFDSSVTTGGLIQSWSWNFGDGSTSNQQNPVHAFPAGSYRVTLSVETSTGCNRFSTNEKNITIDEKPVADFIYNGKCTGKAVSFNDRSAISTGNLTSWFWDFGDGTISTEQNPQKIYPVAGTYQVKLVVHSSLDCVSDTATKNITVAALPGAGVSFQNGCVNKNISFRDVSSAPGDVITKWYWSLGNGNRSSDQNPNASYPAPGSYTIKHVVESANGCISDTTTSLLQIETIPLAKFSISDGCEGQALQFKDSSSIDLGTITMWNWSFGDGDSSSIQNPEYTYGAPGNYTVKLSVTSVNGCTSETIAKSISIEGIPAVSFTNSAACPGNPVQFTNQTSLSFGAITTYEWNFGDGTISSSTNPAHTYNREGDYVTSLKAVTANGCEANISKAFPAHAVHAFAGNDTTVAIGQPTQLHASGGNLYQWSPPDFLNVDTISNPIAILDHDQRYVVKVTTEQGCVGFDDISIRVLQGPDVYVPNAFAPNGKNKIFRPVLSGIRQLDFFSVYNRWGQLVFSTSEPGKGWDGKVNSVDQPSAVFVWILKARDYTGREITKKGTVMLIR